MNIVVLTGAGISAESGIRTFRDEDGLWEGEPVEIVATPEGFAQQPARVHQFYNKLRHNLQQPETQPNDAHYALARLEHDSAHQVLVVTQNVDNLHESAGSDSLIHMHGELLKCQCTACNAVYEWTTDTDTHTICPVCRNEGTVRPHIVWFGEMPLQMQTIYEHLERCHLFVAIGTSGVVYPAAGFVSAARAAGAITCELNLNPTAINQQFMVHREGPASQTVPSLVSELQQSATASEWLKNFTHK